jgi:hypothetical protein
MISAFISLFKSAPVFSEFSSWLTHVSLEEDCLVPHPVEAFGRQEGLSQRRRAGVEQ